MDIGPFVKLIERQKLRCEGVAVLRRGGQIAGHRWIPEAPRNQYSVAKSFVSIAIGMAVDRGKLSLGSRVVDVCLPDQNAFGAGPGKRLASLTLEHLLSMTRGHKEFSRPPTLAQALAQPLIWRPGARFVYDNGSTLIASAMFTRAMGMPVRDFLLDALFRPLGIPDPEWPQSPDGHTAGASGLVLSTSSLALFGQFLLRRGAWPGAGNSEKQLVSPEWIDQAGRPQVHTRSRAADGSLGYGFGFWPCRHGAYRADGKRGQYLIVLPRFDAVVALNADEPEPAPILNAVWEKILPGLDR